MFFNGGVALGSSSTVGSVGSNGDLDGGEPKKRTGLAATVRALAVSSLPGGAKAEKGEDKPHKVCVLVRVRVSVCVRVCAKCSLLS